MEVSKMHGINMEAVIALYMSAPAMGESRVCVINTIHKIHVIEMVTAIRPLVR